MNTFKNNNVTLRNKQYTNKDLDGNFLNIYFKFMNVCWGYMNVICMQ